MTDFNEAPKIENPPGSGNCTEGYFKNNQTHRSYPKPSTTAAPLRRSRRRPGASRLAEQAYVDAVARWERMNPRASADEYTAAAVDLASRYGI